jgi:hypothetical protein
VQEEATAAQVAVADAQVQLFRAAAALHASRSVKQSLTARCAAAADALLACSSQAAPSAAEAAAVLATSRDTTMSHIPRNGLLASTLAAAPAARRMPLPPLALPAARGADAALCCTSQSSPSVFAPRTYGHAARHSAVSGMPGLLADFARHTMAYQAAFARRCDRRPYEICWFHQLPYRVATGAQISFSTQMGSQACVAAFVLSYNVSSLEAMLQLKEQEVLLDADCTGVLHSALLCTACGMVIRSLARRTCPFCCAVHAVVWWGAPDCRRADPLRCACRDM